MFKGLLVYHAFEYPGLLTEKLDRKSTNDKVNCIHLSKFGYTKTTAKVMS